MPGKLLHMIIDRFKFLVGPSLQTCFLLFFLACGSFSIAQDSIQKPSPYEKEKYVLAGKQYLTSSFHQSLWGKHYRQEWVTPVKVKVLLLDTIAGGLVAYEAGGGRQSKTLRLKNGQNKEYVLRSIDKTFGRALPEIYQNTIVEEIINDQVSTAHPYAAVTVPIMADAARIYHTNPEIVFIPQQQALGEFNKEFGNNLYLFEQRPDGNWEEATNFGNSKNIISTEKLFEKISSSGNDRVDQVAFVRARLFDMFVGDWGRHEDQWRWAAFEDNDKTVYKPIPRDRDQLYTKFDGTFITLFSSAAGVGHLETFNSNIKDIKEYNFPARNLDRRLANEPVKEQWITTAKELQQLLTNEIIEAAVKQLPPEVFPISGNEIIAKLKSRREHLVDFADKYYSFLAREVEITGTSKEDFFEIKRISDGETMVNIYDINKEGQPKKEPFYSRIFLKTETREIRIFGLGGNDQYSVSGGSNIKIRLIGGADKDIYIDSLNAGNAGKKIKLYDNTENDFNMSNAKLKLTADTAVHLYKYDGFNYSERGIRPIFFYNNEDRIHIGLAYKIEKQKWRREPYAYQHSLAVKYSLMENAFSTEYKGIVTKFIGRWNLDLYGNYDWIRWINYFGLGNETIRMETTKENRHFYRMRTRQGLGSIGLSRNLGSNHRVAVFGFYQSYDVVHDKERYVAHQNNGVAYDRKDFGGGQFDYFFQSVNDVIVPTKGVRFTTSIAYTQNLQETDSSFMRYSTALNFYIPLSKSFGISIKTGAATLSGNTPEFYQMNRIGGGQTLRGYRRYRFYGKTIFYSQNELQWIRNVRGRLFNGKAGLVALVDAGRVWLPGEKSNLIHVGYGGGFLLAPFKKIGVVVTYAMSKEDATVNFRFSRTF